MQLALAACFLAGALARPWLEQALGNLNFFLGQALGFSADGAYHDANLKGVLRRNARVGSLWMNLGLAEGDALPHYADAAAALAAHLGRAAKLGSASLLCDVGYGYGRARRRA